MPTTSEIRSAPEYELTNGVEIRQVTPQEMAELLKTAPTLIRWPFVEEIRGNEPRMNVGASSCLMTYDFSGETVTAGHFTVVQERKSAEQKEQDELRTYRQWLLHVRDTFQRDKNATLVLLGQHASNLSVHRNSEFVQNLARERRQKVEEDLIAIGVDPNQVLDLRGPDIGATAAVYDPAEKRLSYTKYPPK